MTAETGSGPGIALVLAKDFRISSRFQFGAAAHVSAGTMSGKDGSARWTAHSEGIAISFTYASEGWDRRH